MTFMATPRDDNQKPPADDYSKRVFETMFQAVDEEAARRREAVEAAKASDPDKEPFSVEALAQHYSLHDLSGKDQAGDPAIVAEYEATYYLNYPEVRTIEAFAETLKWQDSHEAN